MLKQYFKSHYVLTACSKKLLYKIHTQLITNSTRNIEQQLLSTFKIISLVLRKNLRDDSLITPKRKRVYCFSYYVENKKSLSLALEPFVRPFCLTFITYHDFCYTSISVLNCILKVQITITTCVIDIACNLVILTN